MAPTTRSSAPNTPSSKSTGSGSETPTLTPRKAPQCTKCKRPRAGHPRSGCPFTDTPLKESEAQAPSAALPGNITDALGSMHIASPISVRDEDTKAEIRKRRLSVRPPPVPTESLTSLSTNSQEIVEMLLQPGMFDNDIDNDGAAADVKGKARVVQWQETLGSTPKKARARVKMPGSLASPSPNTSIDSTKDSKLPINTPTSTIMNSNGSTNSLAPASYRARSLVRSMSVEEQENFLAGLEAVSNATIYVVPSADIRTIQISAINLGFYAKIIVSQDESDPQGLLVLGREEVAVDQLFKKVEKESNRSPPGRLRAAAGGAVVGAVGAWAGLAFS